MTRRPCGLIGAEANLRGRIPTIGKSDSEDESCDLSASHSVLLNIAQSLELSTSALLVIPLVFIVSDLLAT